MIYGLSIYNGATAALREVKDHPRRAAAVALIALGIGAGAAIYLNPDLLALSSTQTGRIYDETSPTFLGRAVNLATGNLSETTYSVGSRISEIPVIAVMFIGAAMVIADVLHLPIIG